MRSLHLCYLGSLLLVLFSTAACNNQKDKANKPVVIKGLYSFGPEAALFIDCKSGKEYWAADSSAKLELQYSQLGFEKPYESVYIEVEGEIAPSEKEGPESAYDSTLTVRKLISITKDIPADICK